MLEWSTLVLAVFTVVLAGATLWYAIETHKMNSASKETQKLLERQNGIMAAHNDSLKEQSEAQRNLVGVLGDVALKLIRVGDEISDAGQAVDNFKMMIKMEKFEEIKNKEMNKMKRRP